jgi:hypothetical protein
MDYIDTLLIMEDDQEDGDLGEREYMRFYGEPRNFPLLIKNFEVNVESKESNDADRLNYLIQYCKGKARQAIEHCIIMPREEGHKRAKEILRKNFGRNHVVTQSFLDKVIAGPPIRVSENEKLSQLARDMETCLLGSTQLGNGANINSIDTLGKVVSRLPVHLRSKWAEKASQLYDKNVTPDFSHLTEFVQSRAAVANTYFGQIIGSKVDMRKDGGDKGRRNPPSFKGNNTSLATYGQNVEDVGNESKGRNLLCVLCKGTHHLERCHKFRAQNLQQRRDLIKSKRVCHACLSPGHFVKNCRGARMCGVEGCQRRHHPLHSHLLRTTGPRKICSLVDIVYLVLVQQIPRLTAIVLAFKLFLSGLVHLMVIALLKLMRFWTVGQTRLCACPA